MPTLTSQIPNVADDCDISNFSRKQDAKVNFKVVDIPGSRQLLSRYIGEHAPVATELVFMVKSFTVTGQAYLTSTAE